MVCAASVTLISRATIMHTKSPRIRIQSNLAPYGILSSRGLRTGSRRILDSDSVTQSFTMGKVVQVSWTNQWFQTRRWTNPKRILATRLWPIWPCIMLYRRTQMGRRTTRRACVWSFRPNETSHLGRKQRLRRHRNSIHTSQSRWSPASTVSLLALRLWHRAGFPRSEIKSSLRASSKCGPQARVKSERSGTLSRSRRARPCRQRMKSWSRSLMSHRKSTSWMAIITKCS